MKVIVIGGGWSGCSAAITAKKAGAEKLEKLSLTNIFNEKLI